MTDNKIQYKTTYIEEKLRDNKKNIKNYIQELKLNPETFNVGKKWDVIEDELLKNLVIENIYSYEEIARQFKRTSGSIKARIIEKIIFLEYNNENSKELSEKYNFDVDFLEKRMQYILEKKKEKNYKIASKNLNETKLEKINNDKYYELLENIIERLKKIEEKIYNNDNMSTNEDIYSYTF
tara:strand:- start:473 stop:1015 length:543 start_codon:yes stop_codon:yes gene_type:complete